MYLQLAIIYIGQENETRHYDYPSELNRINLNQNLFMIAFRTTPKRVQNNKPYSCLIRKGLQDCLKDILTNIGQIYV